jgi:hypothetical protein
MMLVTLAPWSRVFSALDFVVDCVWKVSYTSGVRLASFVRSFLL